MRVSINFSALSDLEGKKEIIESLQQNALQAWENKPENTEGFFRKFLLNLDDTLNFIVLFYIKEIRTA